MKISKSEKGTSLIEALVALGIAVIIIAGIVSMVVASLGNTNFTKNQNQATSYAQEAIDVVKQLSNSDYQGFRTIYNNAGGYCMGSDLSLQPKNNFVSGCATANMLIDGIFAREVKILQGSGECIQNTTPTPPPGSGSYSKIEVTVSWTDSKCSRDNLFCHVVGFDTCIVDTSTIPSPT